jgi:hypothetical protein
MPTSDPLTEREGEEQEEQERECKALATGAAQAREDSAEAALREQRLKQQLDVLQAHVCVPASALMSLSAACACLRVYVCVTL